MDATFAGWTYTTITLHTSAGQGYAHVACRTRTFTTKKVVDREKWSGINVDPGSGGRLRLVSKTTQGVPALAEAPVGSMNGAWEYMFQRAYRSVANHLGTHGPPRHAAPGVTCHHWWFDGDARHSGALTGAGRPWPAMLPHAARVSAPRCRRFPTSLQPQANRCKPGEQQRWQGTWQWPAPATTEPVLP